MQVTGYISTTVTITASAAPSLRIERIADLIEEAAPLLIVLVAGRLFKGAQQLFLLGIQILRHLDHHPENLIAGAAAIDICLLYTSDAADD